MRHPTRFYSLAALCATALQIACGDSSGPGPLAATIEPNSATTITAQPGAPVSEPPSVVVRGEDGAPLAGATVTFAITSGGGSITGGTQVTNSAGVATVGSWVLGALPGINTVRASVAGLSPVVIFTATGVDPCTVAVPHEFGVPTAGELSTNDCRLANGFYIDFYSISLPPATYVFTQQSGSFDTYLYLLMADGRPVGFNDDISQTNFDSRIKVMSPGGTYIIAATSFDRAVTGPYTLSTVSPHPDITGCEEVFIEKLKTTTQSLQSTDCPSNGFSDEFIIYLDAGESITVSMSSAVVDSFLTLLGPDGTSRATNDNRDAGTTDARITYTAPGAGFFYIRAGSAVAGATGEYNLTVT